MKTKLYSGLIATLLLLSNSDNLNAQTVADWTFETSHPTTGTNILPEIGTGSLFLYHASSAATYNAVAGNGSNYSYVSAGWTVNDYYQIALNTTGFSNLNISFDMTGSNTGPRSFEIQASVAGGAFTAIPGTAITVTNIAWTTSVVRGTNFSFALPENLSNQANVALKIVMTSNTSIAGSTVQAGGTNRIDNLLIGTTIPTPIYFKDFTLNSKGTQNELKWSTGYESNLENFIIESSENGKDFKEVAKVNANNETSGSEYAYVDMSTKDKHFYRVKSVDKNGAISHTQTLSVSAQNLNGKALQCNFNNSNNTLQVTVDGSYTAMNYSIVNAAGVVIMQQSDKSLKAGMNVLDMNGLSAGLYFVKCEYGGKMYSFKIVK